MSAFAAIQPVPEDAIFALNTRFKADTFPHRMNLGVGAYKGSDGKPYVFDVVKQAERDVLADLEANRTNHEYLPIRGFDDFTASAAELLYGSDSPAIKEDRVARVQGISGTGSIRLAAELLSKCGGKPEVWVSNPTWGNQAAICVATGMVVHKYDYYSASLLGVDFPAMLASLDQAKPGSIVILHLCCHNPTGADLSEAQWNALGDYMTQKQLIPLFDCAYQGFATGSPDEDAYPIRSFVARGMEVISAQSFSKNMGLYNERAGVTAFVTKTASAAKAVKSQLEIIVRQSFSNPPAHGARIVANVLMKQGQAWRDELFAVTGRIIKMRKLLQEEILKIGVPGSWDHITSQRGMFCFSGLSKEQSIRMVEEFHIYMLPNGRINCAALQESQIAYLASSIYKVMTQPHKL
jgi:aspartate aminotransferase, cytoplasmic